MRERITPFRVLVGVAIAVVIAIVILMKMGTKSYLLLPDPAHPVAPLVRVADGKPAKGGGELFFVDVQEKKASQFDLIFQSWIHPHSTRYPTTSIIPPGATEQQVLHSDLRQMATSKQVAAAVAERQLGYHVVAEPLGTLVDYVDPHSHAFGKLQMGDVIDSVNRTPVLTLAALHSHLVKLKPGDIATLGIRRGSKRQTVRVQTISQKGNAVVGILVEQTNRIILPKKVTIDSGDIGGPSAGLAFTLEVMQRLGTDVTHGYKVAATGEMNLDGTVTAIGGVEQKTWGAREAHAQVFLVPADGGNAKEAKRFAGPDLKIIPVRSIGQALQALSALPKVSEK